MENLNWLALVLGGLSVVVAVVGAFRGWVWIRQKIDEGFGYLAERTKVEFLRNVDDVLIEFALELYDDCQEQLAGKEWGPEAKEQILKILKARAIEAFGGGFVKHTETQKAAEDLIRTKVKSAAKRAEQIKGMEKKPDPLRG